MEIPSIWETVETSEQERLLSAAADLCLGLAVYEGFKPEAETEIRESMRTMFSAAGFECVVADRLLDSLMTQGDRAWTDMLHDVASGVPEHRRALVMADLCLESNSLDHNEMVSGTGCRRLNAVLDLLDMPFAGADVQDYYAALAMNLASMKTNYLHNAAVGTAAVAGGFASGFFFIPSINTATQKGIEFFADEITKTDECSLATAHLMACAAAACEYPEGEADARRVRDTLQDLAGRANEAFSRARQRSANVYTGDGAYADRQRRVLNAALAVINEMLGDADESVPVPDLTRMTLSAAEDLLSGMGLEALPVDPLNRWIMNKTNWYVSKQSPEAGSHRSIGSPVTLTVDKYAA